MRINYERKVFMNIKKTVQRYFKLVLLLSAGGILPSFCASFIDGFYDGYYGNYNYESRSNTEIQILQNSES